MFALPPLFALVVFILARPLDLVAELRGVPFLHVFLGLTLCGLLLDARLGYARLELTPALKWALAVVGVALLSGLVMAPDTLSRTTRELFISFAVFLLVSQCVQRFRALETLAAGVLVSSIFISAVCVHQGLQPKQCVAVDPGEGHSSMGRPDGRACEVEPDCFAGAPEPQALYRCEHAGLFGITSIADGRVRYLGVLHDPNEMALAVSASLPFAVAFYQRRRKKRYVLLVGVAVILAALAVIMSASRSGILIFLAVFGVYFLERFGVKGAVAAGLAGLPVLLLGGRSGTEASSSTTERLEVWQEGMDMFRSFPVFGVGHGQFTEHHHLTAHNSVLLAAAEGGLIAPIVWVGLLYVAFKIPLRVLREVEGAEGEVARTWAIAILASLAGTAVGSMFLTFNYHFVLWTYVGMSASLWFCVRRHQPSFEVRVATKDVALIAATSLGLLAVIFVTSRVGLG